MRLIKVSSGDSALNQIFLRQSPQGLGVWRNYKFIVNQDIDECDYWIVCHVSGLRFKEETRCNPKNTIYISMEPSEDVVRAHSKFLAQFGKLVLVDRKIKHDNILYKNIHTWWAGLKVKHQQGIHSFGCNNFFSYDEFKVLKPQKKKDKISIIVSNKRVLPGHISRLKFIQNLMRLPIGSYIDLYGSEFKSIDDKLDAIAPYKYHMVLENSVVDDYWSEKLADAYLGYSFPIYSGCPNIADYFSANALMVLNINDGPEIISEKLLELIFSKTYENNFQHIVIARNDILNKYNIFEEMVNLCTDSGGPDREKINVVIRPNDYFSTPFYFRGLKRLMRDTPSFYRFLHKIKSILLKVIN